MIEEENRVYLDEAGSNLAMTPNSSWSPKNERAYDKKPACRGSNLSMIGAIKSTGMKALYSYDGAVDSNKFVDFVENNLLKELKDGDVLIMDNSAVHHSGIVRNCLNKHGIRVLYLPPYSPELNPIEEAWSVIKNKLRHEKSRTLSAYVNSLEKAKNCITVEKIAGFFKHAEAFQNLC
jgi:transposase|tara:strand:+ start:224 stop:757 length:534 start_codon:yes stop_codon:yes gene_type:complete